MFNAHPAGEVFAGMIRSDKAAAKAKEKAKNEPVLDAVEEEVSGPAAAYASADIALKAVAAVQEWAEVAADDLDEGEGLANRLYMLLVGVADADLDGEIGDDEWAVMEAALESAWSYLESKGASEADIDALLNETDDEAAARVQELVASRLPDGDEAAAEEMDSFAFGDGSDEAALDSAIFDATYKMKVAFRGGKKVRIKKRVSGHVRLSAKQKLGIRKMLRKSHSAGAQMRRAKSVRMRKKAGL